MSFSLQSMWMGVESLFQPTTLLTIGIRGVLLLAAAALARTLEVDPEAALRDAVSRFEHRLRELEGR